MKYRDKISVHCVVRDEQPTIGWALLSVAPFVKEVLVCDTGSTDRTIEIVEFVNGITHNIKLTKRNLPDVRGWSTYNNWDKEIKRSSEITEIKNKMFRTANAEFILILDGDEVWYEKDVYLINRYIDKMNDTNKDYLFVPFHWVDNELDMECTMADFGIPSVDFRGYAVTPRSGRLFRKEESFFLKGPIPNEVGYYKGKQICDDGEMSLYASDMIGFLHYEIPFKPWRRKSIKKEPIKFGFPEVFSRYPNILGLSAPIGKI